MEDSSENETCITISSDNFSPAKPSNKPKGEGEDNCSSIVLSDTELEEGEISGDDDEQESKETKCSPVKIDNIKSTSKTEIGVDSKSGSIKRKLDVNFEANKKGKYNEAVSNTEKNNCSSAEFPWSQLRVLVVGDERVKNLDWKEWDEMPTLESSYTKHCNLEMLCNLVEKNLYKEYDIVFVFSFHHDFVNINESFFSETSDKLFMDLKSDVNIIGMLTTVQKYHSKWERQFPNTYVIWTLPYPPDFFKFNSVAFKGKNINQEKVIDEKSQNELTRNYYALAKKFLKDWKTNNKSIPIFPLNKVLFIKKHCYKKTFEGNGSPKYPKRYLIDGFYPSKLMVLYIAYLLIEFLVDYEFYPENKYGFVLKDLERKLEQIDPTFKTYFHNDKNNSISHKRSRRSSHYSHKKNKHNSLSPSRKHSRSRSRSRRRRSRSSSRHRRRHRSSSRRKRRSYSRSRSGSLSTRRKAHSKSSTRRSSSKSRYSQSNKHLSSLSPSSSTSDSSSVKTENHETIYGKDKDSKDEVSYFKTLRYLREVHEIQCSVYRKKPHTHPLYNSEKEIFLKKQNSKLPLELHLPKWDSFWKQKMEKIFEETWATKRDQLTSDLNKKGSFSSLHNVTNNNKNNLTDICSTAKNLNDGQEIAEKKQETISNFLSNLDSNLSFKNKGQTKSVVLTAKNLSDGQEIAEKKQETISNFFSNLDSTLSFKNKTSGTLVDVKNSDFTLADIFKDACPQDNNSCSKNTNQAETSNVFNKNNETYNSSNQETHVPEMPQIDSDSEGDSIRFDDSDLDVDEILGNPDVLQCLEEINIELQNAAAAPDKDKKEASTSQTAPLGPTPSSSLQNDLSFLFNSKNEQKKECSESLKEEFVNVLKMLFRVSKRLGPLGLSVSALYHRASEDIKSNKQTFSSLNSDSKALLVLVEKKLKSFLKENLPQVQKAIYSEITERLQSLLQKVDVQEQSRFPKVNIFSIAAATVGKQLTDVIAFIKNTLLYHGYTDCTHDDVMNIYMSVKSSQLDMEKM